MLGFTVVCLFSSTQTEGHISINFIKTLIHKLTVSWNHNVKIEICLNRAFRVERSLFFRHDSDPSPRRVALQHSILSTIIFLLLSFWIIEPHIMSYLLERRRLKSPLLALALPLLSLSRGLQNRYRVVIPVIARRA